MLNGCSLCLTYLYNNFRTGKTQKRLYRVADYDRGYYIPVITQGYSDEYVEVVPRFIKYPQEYEPAYCSAVLRFWEVLQFGEDNRTYTTKSAANNQREFFEVVFGLEKYANDDSRILQNKFKEGIKLPRGISDNFLLVTSMDEEEYIVLSCRKNMFTFDDGVYKIKTNLADPIHSVHSLKEVCISRDSVFNTAPFYFIDENGNEAECRYFYNRDHLPKADGCFYLHELEEYVPYFINKYLRKKSRTVFSKSDIKKITEEIQYVFLEEKEFSFFVDSGWSIEDVNDKIPHLIEIISKYFKETGTLENLIEQQIINDPQIKEIYFSKACKLWKESTEPEKMALEQEIDELTLIKNNLKSDIEVMIDERNSLSSELKVLRENKENFSEKIDSIRNTVEETMSHLDEKMSDYLTGYLFIKHFTKCVLPSNAAVTQVVNDNAFRIKVRDSDNECTPVIINDKNRMKRLFQKNLGQVGIKSDYSASIGALLCGNNRPFHSVIISGMYARGFADAVSYTMYGVEATIVTLLQNQFNYSELYNLINEVHHNVILIENMLDACNETISATLCKDFPNRIFVFSYENEEIFTLLSKGIWNYSLLINTDVACNDPITSAKFYPAKVDFELLDYEYSSDPVDIFEIDCLLKSFKISRYANRAFLKMLSFENEYLDNDALFTKSTIIKLYEFYKNNIDIEKMELQKYFDEKLLYMYIE